MTIHGLNKSGYAIDQWLRFRRGGSPAAYSGVLFSNYDDYATRIYQAGQYLILAGTQNMDETGNKGDTWTELARIDVVSSKLTSLKAIYAFNLYRGPSATVTVSDTDGFTDTNSLTVLDNVAIPGASALPRSDYTVKAGVYVTALSGGGLSQVKVVILKNNVAWLDSGWQNVSSTGKIFLTVGTGVSFADDIYDVVLYVNAYNGGSGTQSITARLDSVVAYV